MLTRQFSDKPTHSQSRHRLVNMPKGIFTNRSNTILIDLYTEPNPIDYYHTSHLLFSPNFKFKMF